MWRLFRFLLQCARQRLFGISHGLAAFGAACLIIWSQSAGAQTPVELELVLAIDSSTSVDAQEYWLQKQGLTLAFQHPDVQNAIRAIGPNGIAVSLVQWAGKGAQVTSVDWVHVSDATEAGNLAAKIDATVRQVSGFTDIGGAIDFSTRSLDSNSFLGRRRTIDVSGDGTSSVGDPGFARDRALAKNITINGLVILNFEYDLGDLASLELIRHYNTSVAGGDAAFVLVASDFDDFARAIREKLVREILGSVFSQSQLMRLARVR